MDEDKFKAYDAISNWCSMLIKKKPRPIFLIGLLLSLGMLLNFVSLCQRNNIKLFSWYILSPRLDFS
jgi:hypothetical protein